MARFVGKVRRSDLEGGVIQLEARDGQVFELEGEAGGNWAEWIDRDVVIEGSVDRQALSFTMTGPRLIVTAIKAA